MPLAEATDDLLDVLQAVDEADAAHHVFGVVDLLNLGADVVVAALDGGDDVFEREDCRRAV